MCDPFDLSLLIWSHCFVLRAFSLRSMAETWIFEQLSVVKCSLSVQSPCNSIILFLCHTFGPSATQAPFQATLHFKHILDLIFTPQPLQMPMLIQFWHQKTSVHYQNVGKIVTFATKDCTEYWTLAASVGSAATSSGTFFQKNYLFVNL